MIEENNGMDKVTEKVKKIKSKSFTDYIDASMLMIVGVLIIAIICTFFTEFIFGGELNWAEISANTLSVSACTVSIYLLLRSYAIRKGRKTDEWKESSERLQTTSKRILNEGKAKRITEYCREWEDERLNNDIEDVLAPVGITLAEYKEKYAKYSKAELKAKCTELTAYQLKTVLRAKRVKRLKFNERYFYSGTHGLSRHRSPSGELSTRQLNRIITARIVLTSSITMLLSTTLLWDLILNFSWEALIKCVIKISIIIFFGVTGMLGGYTFATINEVDEMQSKADETEIFLKWCEDKETNSVKEPQIRTTVE